MQICEVNLIHVCYVTKIKLNVICIMIETESTAIYTKGKPYIEYISHCGFHLPFMNTYHIILKK